jgi:subtilase family serine protease
MNKKLCAPRRALGLAVIGAAAVAAGLTATSVSRAAAPSYSRISVNPEISAPQTAVPGTDQFSCQSSPIDGSAGPRCYSPNQIQQAYGFSGLIASGVDGSGKTIVIVDAFSNPYVADDLAIEDATFGLPAPPSFTVTAPAGSPPPYDNTNAEMVDWAGEISLDVVSAHAMAPGANIVLVEAASSSDADLYNAEKAAFDQHLGDVYSQSFGEAESCVDPAVFGKWQALFAQMATEGITTFASTGDSGSSQFNCDSTAAILAPSFPAVDPNVTAVGGTTLSATDPDGNYLGETGWTEQLFGCNPPALDSSDINCSGGGFSTIFSRPSWQRSMLSGVGTSGRGVPDISYDAGVNGGILIHSGALLEAFYGLPPTAPFFFIFGGTSAGSPQWSALAADADQMAGHDIGSINKSLYQLGQAPPKYAANFHDATTGNNDVAEIGGEGYDAGPGWDAVTGIGTPIAGHLVPALAKKG